MCVWVSYRRDSIIPFYGCQFKTFRVKLTLFRNYVVRLYRFAVFHYITGNSTCMVLWWLLQITLLLIPIDFWPILIAHLLHAWLVKTETVSFHSSSLCRIKSVISTRHRPQNPIGSKEYCVNNRSFRSFISNLRKVFQTLLQVYSFMCQ